MPTLSALKRTLCDIGHRMWERGYCAGNAHAPAPHATAFACSGIPLPRGIYPEAEVCLGTIPTVKYSKSGYKELGENVIREIRPDTHAVLLGNHGAVTFGRDLVEAFY